jgi:hypothetical protein
MGAMLDPLQGGGSPYLLLTVRRGPELVRDALTRIRAAMRGNSLKRPLKVRHVSTQTLVWYCTAKDHRHLVPVGVSKVPRVSGVHDGAFCKATLISMCAS